MFTISSERKAVTDEIEVLAGFLQDQNCRSLQLHCNSFIKQKDKLKSQFL